MNLETNSCPNFRSVEQYSCASGFDEKGESPEDCVSSVVAALRVVAAERVVAADCADHEVSECSKIRSSVAVGHCFVADVHQQLDC